MKSQMKKVAAKAVKGHEKRMHKDVKKMAKGGKVKKYQAGGMAGLDRAAVMSGRAMPATGGPSMAGLDQAAAMSGRAMPAAGRLMGIKKGGAVKKMAKGGKIDGVAHKGKTKGTMIKMAKGGMAKKGSRGC